MRLFALLLVCINLNTFSQNIVNDSIRLAQPTISLEFMAAPLFDYKGLGIGLGILSIGIAPVLVIYSN